MDYLPAPDLDADLADLAYAAVHGWPDQRPYTAAFLRSRLRPRGMTATTLVLGREHGGRLVAAAALRWPATLEDSRVTCSVRWSIPKRAAPASGRTVLAAIVDVMAARPGVRVTTIAVPESRTIGWSLFERAGWTRSATSVLLQRELPADILLTTVAVRARGRVSTSTPRSPPWSAPAAPTWATPTARDTLAQWRDDERYVSDGLLLVDGPDGLVGAALVYPLACPGTGEPAEARLEEVLVASGSTRRRRRRCGPPWSRPRLHVGAAAGRAWPARRSTTPT